MGDCEKEGTTAPKMTGEMVLTVAFRPRDSQCVEETEVRKALKGIHGIREKNFLKMR